MPDSSSEKIIGMRLALPASWQKKLKLRAAQSGEPKAGARTEVMKAIAAWINEPYPPGIKTLRSLPPVPPTTEKEGGVKHAPRFR